MFKLNSLLSRRKLALGGSMGVMSALLGTSLPASASSVSRDAASTVRSTRVLYRGMQGRVRCNQNWAPIHQNSVVVITAAEYALSGGTFGLDGRPRLGEANVYVTNIGPHDPEGGDGGVEFHLHVDSSSPLDVIVTISVLGDVEQLVKG